jgi:hypothetical protein
MNRPATRVPGAVEHKDGDRSTVEAADTQELDLSPEAKKRRCTAYELAIYHAFQAIATGDCTDTAVMAGLLETVPGPMKDLVEVHLFRVTVAHKGPDPYPWLENAKEVAGELSKLEDELY